MPRPSRPHARFGPMAEAPGEVAEWLKAPHSKFGDGDAFADDPVLIRLNKLTLSSTGQRRGASLSCSVLSRWVAKW